MAAKRSFDVVFAALGIMCVCWLIPVVWVGARLSTGLSGFFCQTRVGKNGRLIRVVKFRTMKHIADLHSTVTQNGDPRITRFGRFLRKLKIDELPQLWNVLVGDMSFVGPRPDVPGFADRLEGADRRLLMLRPGITGPATLKYRNEEELLAGVPDPESYNREVIWPDKVKINLQYLDEMSIWVDVGVIWKTITRR